MSLSKMACFKTLAKPYPFRFQSPSSSPVFVRLFSFATPEEAAAERRKRKRRFRIEPPLSSLRHHQHQQAPSQQLPRPQNPNAPKLPEPVSALTGNRLNLHNKILKLIRENDLEEAALYTRHSVYSNCRPTIYTCNAVMAALLRQQKYHDLLSFHRFINQAGIAANVVTYNILLTAYLDCGKPDIALEQYKLLIDGAPFNPSPTTYRILIKGLVDAQKVEKAIELKVDMYTKGYKPDPTVYSYLMSGLAKTSDADGVLGLYEELKGKLGQEEVLDGVIYGNLMKGYFLKGMENEAMECYEKATQEGTRVKMSVVAYNYVLEALSKNGKFDLALNLFDRMKNAHNPPTKLTVNLGSYNVVVDGYCAEKRFDKAIEVFNSMGEKNIEPDTLSYNVLIDQLCSNGLLNKAEELYKGMSDNKVNPDEYTFVVLMDTCFKENRPDDAAGYYRTMIESKLRPKVEVYNKLVDELVKFGKIDEAKSFFDMMVPKLRMRDDEYKFIMNALLDVGRHEDVFEIVGRMLSEENDYTDELDQFLRERLSKDGREEEFTKLKEDIATQKAEAAARAAKAAEEAKAKSKVDLSSLKIFGKSANNLENEESQEGTLAATSGDAEALSASANGEESAAQEVGTEEGSVEMNFGDKDMVEEATEAKADAETKRVTA